MSAGKRYTADRHTQVLDARGRLVMPGLVNARTHLYQVLPRGVNDTEPLTPWLRATYAVGDVLTTEDCLVGAWLGCLGAGVRRHCGVRPLLPQFRARPCGCPGFVFRPITLVILAGVAALLIFVTVKGFAKKVVEDEE